MPAAAAEPELDRTLTDLQEYLNDEPPAISLPPAAFTSTALWELERDRIFHRSWFVVARSEQLSKVGDYLALTLAGEPVVVARAADGLHALSSVCRHRFMPVVESGAGNTDAFTCPYHLWRYGLDGRLRGAPFMGGNSQFSATDCRLPAFAVQEWNGFVWVNLDPAAAPIGTELDLVADEFANYRLAELIQIDSWCLRWQANWKLVMENLHENYHVIGLHRDTLLPISLPGGGDLDVAAHSPRVVRIRIPLAMPMPAASLQLTAIQEANIMMMTSFPGSGILALADRVAWFGVIPTAIDQVEVRGGILATAESVHSRDAATDLARSILEINEEDRIGLEAVQRGVTSRYAERGRLSPKEAPGVLAFYRNLADALSGPQTGGR